MEIYHAENEYIEDLKKRALLPEGFKCAAAKIDFIPEEKPSGDPLPMNLSLILTDTPTDSFGAVFTKNRFPGAPVVIGKKRLSEKEIRGCLINNKISNVCTPGGEETALNLCSEMAALLDISPETLFPFSTGIIGWKLPFEKMKAAYPKLKENISGDSILPVARAIMTTDAFPKIRNTSIGDGMIVGIAKGAGMIEPNMATMLSFILTDIDMERETLREILKEVVEETYNCLSIDGDQSTSDSVMIISSRKKPAVPPDQFKKALLGMCKQLAEDIVRNGEGTEHVMKVTVKGYISWKLARSLGKAVINSQLVKTAICGNDPNVGRIIMAIGDYLGNHTALPLKTESLKIKMAGREIFRDHQFLLNQELEVYLSGYLKERQLNSRIKGYPQHNKLVEIEILIGEGDTKCTVLGSDLTYEYVRENADYRS